MYFIIYPFCSKLKDISGKEFYNKSIQIVSGVARISGARGKMWNWRPFSKMIPVPKIPKMVDPKQMSITFKCVKQKASKLIKKKSAHFTSFYYILHLQAPTTFLFITFI